MSLKVTVTQCAICGTLSIHWGAEKPNSCTQCTETAHMVNTLVDQQMMNDKDFIDSIMNMGPPEDLDGLDISSNNAREPWNEIINPFDQGDFVNLPEVSAVLEDIEGNPLTIKDETRSLEDANSLVPLISSIRASFVTQWDNLGTALKDINSYLLEPEDHWKYLAKLDIHRDQIESIVSLLNSYISEAYDLKVDTADVDQALFVTLATVPEYWFEGKDELDNNKAMLFYFDGGEDFNTYTSIIESPQMRRKFNRDQ